jgi:methylase of polypeptide subunit release factors
MTAALVELLRNLGELGYRFTSVTPETHALVNARPSCQLATSLTDVLGWNRPFSAELLPGPLFDSMQRAQACTPVADGLWRATLRVSSVGHLLFVHSAYPTLEQDAVFFGPDSYRFARAIRKSCFTATRAVDVGCGSGVGGVILSHFGELTEPVVLSDINPKALALATVNAAVAGADAEIVQSDVLRDIDGTVDLVLANPPYLVDDASRAYRHGGEALGAALSTRIVKEALQRLDRDGGGSLLLYTGVAMVHGTDPFLASISDDLRASGARYEYEELDPDVFASELSRPAYQDVDRIAVVLLRATLEAKHRG